MVMNPETAPSVRDRNLAAVGAMYRAFGAGDLPAVLAQLDADVEWCNRGPEDISYFGVKHGREVGMITGKVSLGRAVVRHGNE